MAWLGEIYYRRKALTRGELHEALDRDGRHPAQEGVVRVARAVEVEKVIALVDPGRLDELLLALRAVLELLHARLLVLAALQRRPARGTGRVLLEPRPEAGVVEQVAAGQLAGRLHLLPTNGTVVTVVLDVLLRRHGQVRLDQLHDQQVDLVAPVAAPDLKRQRVHLDDAVAVDQRYRQALVGVALEEQVQVVHQVDAEQQHGEQQVRVVHHGAAALPHRVCSHIIVVKYYQSRYYRYDVGQHVACVGQQEERLDGELAEEHCGRECDGD